MINEKELIGFIEQLLEEHDCIIIPNFGGFVVQKEDYKFIAEENSILPKRRWVAFNQKLNTDDGFLSHELSIHFQITQKNAQKSLLDFAESISNKIKETNAFDFGIIGSFSLNDQEKFQFIPNPSSNFEANMFGLTKVSTNPSNTKAIKLVEPAQLIEEKVEQPAFITQEEVENTSKGKVKNWVYASIIFVVAAISTFVLTEPQNQNFTSSLNPFASFKQYSAESAEKVEVLVKKVEKIISKQRVEVQPEVETIKEEPLVVATETLPIELVAGSFLTREQAEKGVTELKEKGFEEVYIIENQKAQKYVRISVGAVKTMDEGYQKAAEIQKEKKLDIWVFENKK